MVQGRTLNGADDIAAVIHGRVTKWLDTVGDHSEADRIVGLFPAAGLVTNTDADKALQDRRNLIEQNARTLVVHALRREDPWIASLGRPPADPGRGQTWLRRLDTIAAYRDCWQVSGNAILGAEPRSRVQMAQWQAGQRAVAAALDDSQHVNSSVDVSAEIRSPQPGTHSLAQLAPEAVHAGWRIMS